MITNNLHYDSHFWYELSLLQWLVVIGTTWARNVMCMFSMLLLLRESKQGLKVIPTKLHLPYGLCIFAYKNDFLHPIYFHNLIVFKFNYAEIWMLGKLEVHPICLHNLCYLSLNLITLKYERWPNLRCILCVRETYRSSVIVSLIITENCDPYATDLSFGNVLKKFKIKQEIGDNLSVSVLHKSLLIICSPCRYRFCPDFTNTSSYL